MGNSLFDSIKFIEIRPLPVVLGRFWRGNDPDILEGDRIAMILQVQRPSFFGLIRDPAWSTSRKFEIVMNQDTIVPNGHPRVLSLLPFAIKSWRSEIDIVCLPR